MSTGDGPNLRLRNGILGFALALWALTVSAEHPAPVPLEKGVRFAALASRAPALGESELLSMARDPSPEVRQYAVLLLAEIESPNEPVLARLTEALGDEADVVRLQALAGLMRMGRPATRALVEALADFEVVAEHSYQSVAMNSGRTLPISRSDLAFAALLHARTTDTEALVEALASRDAQESEEVSAEDLNSTVPSNRDYSAGTERMGFRRLLTVRSRLQTLFAYGPVDLTPSLYEALSDGSPLLKVSASRMFARAGPAAAEATPLLASAVTGGDNKEIEAAARAMAAIGPTGSKALRELLGHAAGHVRRIALGVYPADQADAAAVFARALEDPDPTVVRAALDRIGAPEQRIGAEEGVAWYQYRNVCGSHWQLHPFLVEFRESGIACLERIAAAEAPVVRAAAIAALASIGCSQAERGSAIADILLSRLSDAVDEIAEQAAEHLEGLAQSGALPSSPEQLYGVLGEFLSAARNERLPTEDPFSLRRLLRPDPVPQLLSVLERADLSGAPRAEWTAQAMESCLEEDRCLLLRALVKGRPDWRGSAFRVFLERRNDAMTVDLREFDILSELESGEPAYSRLLQTLLDHPDRRVRAKAAIRLADLPEPPPAAWEILQSSVLSERDTWLRRSSLDALARLGERAVGRLVALIEDPRLNLDAVGWLVTLRPLGNAVEVSPSAAAALLRFAANGARPGLQEKAILELSEKRDQYRRGELEDVLRSSLASDHVGVRVAALKAWTTVGFPPEEIVEQVLADPDIPSWKYTRLVAMLAPGDPRRVAWTQAALTSEDNYLQASALEQAGGLGEVGDQMLAEYVARGGYLGESFFKGARRLGSTDKALLAALEDRYPNAAKYERKEIDRFAGRERVSAWLDIEGQYSRLEQADLAVRENAADILLTGGENPWARGGVIAAVVMDVRVREYVRERLGLTLDMLFPPGSQLHSRHDPGLPGFPWPPPAGYRRVVIPRHLIAPGEGAVLGDAYDALVSALTTASDGFEHGLFKGVPGGFALVARMERIRRNGRPLPEPDRWVREGTPKLSLWEFLGDLFFERPGYFRVIVFVVTDEVNPGADPTAHLPEPEQGAPSIPPELAAKALEGQEVLALVYTFERRNDAKVTPWESSPSAKQHLTQAGVWMSIESSARRR